MVQAAIVRAIPGLGDSPGISALVAVVQTLDYSRSRCTSIQGFYETQADPAGELAALRSMQPKQNVLLCHNSARRKGGRGLLMDGFLRRTQ
jgi:hypothetical protein